MAHKKPLKIPENLALMAKIKKEARALRTDECKKNEFNDKPKS
ncbi:MAG TPA: hypothetical protein PLM75_08030 [bacterium]|nr:hypothetical protein [bacterium]